MEIILSAKEIIEIILSQKVLMEIRAIVINKDIRRIIVRKNIKQEMKIIYAFNH